MKIHVDFRIESFSKDRSMNDYEGLIDEAGNVYICGFNGIVKFIERTGELEIFDESHLETDVHAFEYLFDKRMVRPLKDIRLKITEG